MKETHDLEEGFKVAKPAFKVLAPFVDRCILVGSMGRQEDRIGDVDILCSPMPGAIDQIEIAMRESGYWKKGGERYMCIEEAFDSDLQLDLYLCHPPAQWGVLTAVRLNPAPLVIWAKQKIDEMGYRREGGTIYSAMGELKLPEEEDWFNLLGLDCVPPEERWELTRRLRLI